MSSTSPARTIPFSPPDISEAEIAEVAAAFRLRGVGPVEEVTVPDYTCTASAALHCETMLVFIDSQRDGTSKYPCPGKGQPCTRGRHPPFYQGRSPRDIPSPAFSNR